MGAMTPEQGYFSVLRWRRDVTRDEAKNIAVILVDHDGVSGGIRYAPVSSVSTQFREQGVLDSLLAGLERQFEEERKPSLETLMRMYESIDQALYFTEPKPTAVFDLDKTLNALFRAYVAPQQRPTNRLAKGAILDRVIKQLRRRGLEVHRFHRVGDFYFDAVVAVQQSAPRAIEVLTFAAGRKEPIAAEHDAGHFLYALDRLDIDGLAVIQPPGPEASDVVISSYDRVKRWLSDADVTSTTPEELPQDDVLLSLHFSRPGNSELS